MILGIDEVGRGPWAGPLTVGAVVLGGEAIEGLTDSKKLSKKRREALSAEIYEKAAAVGLGWVDASEIDELGLSESLVLATRRAVEQIKVPYHEIIIDGTVNFLRNTSKGKYVTTLKKADLLIASVSAASIVAKVARDNYMAMNDDLYPGYGFAGHSGYGTAKHRAAIEELGVTPLHRLSFAPLVKYRAEAVGADFESNSIKRTSSTTAIGQLAEAEVAKMLEVKGHAILERNWRTRFCEIDIVSLHQDTLYFTEVKYRRKTEFGDGLDAITPRKLKQMAFAAEYFALANKLAAKDRRLAAAAVGGEPPVIEQFLVLE